MAPSKRGLAWPTSNPTPVHVFTKPGSKITWLYNWSPHPTPNATSLHFIPMQWNHVNASDLSTNPALSPSSPENPPTLLTFNEPDLPSQANLSPSQAAETWLSHIEPLRRRGVRSGSPAVCSAPSSLPWMQEFLKLIREKGSDVDFFCFHWYGVDLGAFYDYIWSTFYALGGPEGSVKSVWITEFGCTNWSAERPLGREEVEVFARGAWKYLDEEVGWVERYAWFGAMGEVPDNVGEGVRLIDGKGELTGLGREYRDG